MNSKSNLLLFRKLFCSRIRQLFDSKSFCDSASNKNFNSLKQFFLLSEKISELSSRKKYSKEFTEVSKKFWSVSNYISQNLSSFTDGQIFKILSISIKIPGQSLEVKHVESIFSVLLKRLEDQKSEWKFYQYLLIVQGLKAIKICKNKKKEFLASFIENISEKLHDIESSNREICNLLTDLAFFSVYGFGNPDLFLMCVNLIFEREENNETCLKPYEIILLAKAVAKANMKIDMQRIFESVLKLFNSKNVNEAISIQLSIHLLTTLVSTNQYNPVVFDKLIEHISKFSASQWMRSSVELRSLKFIEMKFRLEMIETFSSLSMPSITFLSSIRDLKFFDPCIHHNTILSYQLSYFLSKHNFPCEKEIVGPYALKICDGERKVCFECCEYQEYFPNTRILKFFPSNKIQHLQLLGWKVITVPYFIWKDLGNRDEKLKYVQELMCKNNLIGNSSMA